jgi:tetratricopeptide (TPR) repeat protein
LNKELTKEAPPKNLREAIARSGLTVKQIEAKINCTARSLYSWKNGARPSDHFIGELTKVLGVNVWAMYEPTTENKDAKVSITSSVTLSHRSPLMTATSLPTPTTIDKGLQIYAAAQMSSLWDMFHLSEEAGSITAISLALESHRTLLHTLQQSAHNEHDEQWLARAHCEALILLGRIARDQLDFNQAIAYHDESLHLAIQSGSHDHIIAATMRYAETLKDAGLLYEAVSYCKSGLDTAKKASSRIYGEFLGFAADVYGMLGMSQESEKLVNNAASLSIGAANLPTAGGINFSETAAETYLMRNTLQLGKTKEALLHIERAKKRLVTEFPQGRNIRWEAHLWISTAHVHFAMNEIEEACEDLRKAGRLAQSISSWMALKKVQETTVDLSKQRKAVPALWSLHEELTSMQRVSKRS